MKPMPALRVTLMALLLSVLLMINHRSIGQVGTQLSYFTPKGDIGYYFKKGTSIDFYFVLQTDDGKWKERFGVFYTALSPRLDTFPEYLVQYGGVETKVFPGKMASWNFNMKCIAGELSRRLIRVHGVSLFLGIGLVLGISHVDYYREYETILVENASTDTWIGGLKLNVLLEYRINAHFDVFADASHNMVTSTTFSTSYNHQKFGAGVHYYVNKRP